MIRRSTSPVHLFPSAWVSVRPSLIQARSACRPASLARLTTSRSKADPLRFGAAPPIVVRSKEHNLLPSWRLPDRAGSGCSFGCARCENRGIRRGNAGRGTPLKTAFQGAVRRKRAGGAKSARSCHGHPERSFQDRKERFFMVLAEVSAHAAFALPSAGVFLYPRLRCFCPSPVFVGMTRGKVIAGRQGWRLHAASPKTNFRIGR